MAQHDAFAAEQPYKHVEAEELVAVETMRLADVVGVEEAQALASDLTLRGIWQ
jgi:hypothetical protein